jgi:hypothetical protein
MHDAIHFHGTYRYATRESLELAIASARAVLAEDAGGADAAWMRCFVTRGTVLTVNLSTRVDRYCAAAVFESLAETAVEGAIEARVGDAQVDLYASGDAE